MLKKKLFLITIHIEKYDKIRKKKIYIKLFTCKNVQEKKKTKYVYNPSI